MPFTVPWWPSDECTATYRTWNYSFPTVITTATTATTFVVPLWESSTNAATYAAWNQTFPAIIQATASMSAGQFFDAHITVISQQANLPSSSQDRIPAEARAYESWRQSHTERAEARTREREHARARMAVIERDTQAASIKAEDLLMACLSPQQAVDHIDLGWFDVVSSRDRRFRIYTRTPADPHHYPGQAGNVVLLDRRGRPEARYCVHPPGGLPDADAWLAQKLALEADEDSMMRVANMPWCRSGHNDIRAEARLAARAGLVNVPPRRIAVA
jgi:hypothetical protein